MEPEVPPKRGRGRPKGSTVPRTAATQAFRRAVISAPRYCFYSLPKPTRDFVNRIRLGEPLADTPTTAFHARTIASRIGFLDVALRGAKPIADAVILPGGLSLVRTGPTTWTTVDTGDAP